MATARAKKAYETAKGKAAHRRTPEEIALLEKHEHEKVARAARKRAARAVAKAKAVEVAARAAIGEGGSVED